MFWFIAYLIAVFGGVIARNNVLTGVQERNVGGVAFTIGAESTDVINVAVQINDGKEPALEAIGFTWYLSDVSTGLDHSSDAPSGGVAIGTDGSIEELTANLFGHGVTEIDGDWDIDITEAGTDTWHLVIVLADGRINVSAAITFAA